VAASLLAATGSVQLNSQMALHCHQTTREQSLRQQQRPAEPDRIASEFPDSTQDIPGAQHEGRNRTHERQDSTYSEMKEIAQECPDSVSREHTPTRAGLCGTSAIYRVSASISWP